MFTTRFLDLPPLRAVAGTVRVPGSKSISNRALLLSGFAAGTTTIQGLLHSDDTQVMLEALKQLGCRIEGERDEIVVSGLGDRPLTQQLTSCSASPAGDAAAGRRAGARRRARRPLRAPRHAAHARAADRRPRRRAAPARRAIEYLGQPGFPPLVVDPPPAPLDLDRPIVVRGDVSSQFLTSLLLALPLRAGAMAPSSRSTAS